MSILLIFNHKDPKPWKEALELALPGVPIEVYPDIKDPANVQFVICWKPASDVLANFPNLKVIQSVGAAIDHITRTQSNIPTAIQITRVVDDNLSTDMWEFLLAVVTSQIKRLPTYQKQQYTKHWEQHIYTTFANTTITILGLGKMGGFVAKKFAELGYTVNGWSNSPKAISGVTSYAGMETLPRCIAQSDFIINLLPLTQATENILNASLLQHTTPGAFLINVGRGEHLVEEELIALLDADHLSGALLDVFRTEPLPENHPFWTHPKIQITPHIASLTNSTSASLQIAENYTRFLEKKPLLHTVSLTKGY